MIEKKKKFFFDSNIIVLYINIKFNLIILLKILF